MKGTPHSGGDTESLSAAGPIVCPLCGESGLSGGRQLAKHFLRRHGEKQLSGTVPTCYPICSVPDPGSRAFLASGSGMNSPDHISESLETNFWVKILEFFDADPESRIE